MNCNEAIVWIHEYLDDSLEASDMLKLKQHLDNCNDCTTRLKELEKTEAMVRVLKPVECPDDVTNRIMQAIPLKRRQNRLAQWIRQHPAVAAAVLLVLVMGVSLTMMRSQSNELVVKVNDSDSIVIEGNRVIVPEDSIVYGDLIVENGHIELQGEIRGDLVIVDGNLQQASTANISGKITQVNQAIDWFWYKVSEWFKR